MTRYVVEIEGRSFTVMLADGTARVGDGEAVVAQLEDIAGTPVRLVTIGAATHRVTARRNGPPGAYVLRIDGRRFAVEALDERNRAIRDLAAASRAAAGPAPIVAPMPGLVVRVHVVAGDAVAAGQPVVSIEAMKMENELRAVAPATVRAVRVAPGTAVEKGAVLVELA